MMDWTTIISLLLNLVFGGGFITTLVTLKSSAKKADADVKTTELDNVQEAVKIWRETAETFKSELDSNRAAQKEMTIQFKAELDGYRSSQEEMTKQMERLRSEVAKLSTINSKMVKLLDKINTDNLEQIVEQIKKMHDANT